MAIGFGRNGSRAPRPPSAIFHQFRLSSIHRLVLAGRRSCCVGRYFIKDWEGPHTVMWMMDGLRYCCACVSVSCPRGDGGTQKGSSQKNAGRLVDGGGC